MTSSCRTVFMGSDSFSLPALDELVRYGPGLDVPVEMVAVVTQPDRPVGRGRRLTPGLVKVRAEEHGLPVLQPERLRLSAALGELAAYRPDLIVVAAYGQILSREVLAMPPKGCLNLHPSLLPRYRGASPVAGAILAGDELTGTTIMVMAPAMDAGPIVAQATEPVAPDDTTSSLECRLASLSAALLLRILPGWLAGDMPSQDQDESRATYSGRLSKEDARLDWSQPAELLSRRVRAFNPWPVAYATWAGRTLRLLTAEPEEGRADPGQVEGFDRRRLLIGTGNGLLAVDRLQLPGGRALSAHEFVQGHRSLIGARLG